MKQKNKFYAYMLLASGEKAIVSTWKECEAAVKGQEARYKGFETFQEAQRWLDEGGRYTIKPKPKLEQGIYFDAGTGRGHGVESSVTDERGTDLLSLILPKKDINPHGKHTVAGAKATNNYGELLACKFALQIALQKSIMRIFGDSKLVIDYWSKGFIKKEIAQDTQDLAAEVVLLRKKFEAKGGVMKHISGDHNPADLGFH